MYTWLVRSPAVYSTYKTSPYSTFSTGVVYTLYLFDGTKRVMKKNLEVIYVLQCFLCPFISSFQDVSRLPQLYAYYISCVSLKYYYVPIFT